MELKQILFNEDGTLTQSGVLYYKALKFNNFVLEYENITNDLLKLENRVVDTIRDFIIKLDLDEDPETANSSKHILDFSKSKSDVTEIFVENDKVMVLVPQLDSEPTNLSTLEYDIKIDILNQLLQYFAETH